MLHDPPRMALLANDSVNLIRESITKNHLSQPSLRVGRFQKICQLATRTGNRQHRIHSASALGFVDQGSQFFGELAVTKFCFVGSDLHGNGEEAIVVAFQVRLQKRFELVSTGHMASSGFAGMVCSTFSR